jgi:hypothetical protein
LATWLTRFDGDCEAVFAFESCTGWRYVAEEMRPAGVSAHVAEPADTSVLRGPKRRAKPDKADAKLPPPRNRRSPIAYLTFPRDNRGGAVRVELLSAV